MKRRMLICLLWVGANISSIVVAVDMPELKGIFTTKITELKDHDVVFSQGDVVFFDCDSQWRTEHNHAVLQSCLDSGANCFRLGRSLSGEAEAFLKFAGIEFSNISTSRLRAGSKTTIEHGKVIIPPRTTTTVSQYNF
jgi:hypothetical protein